MCLISNDLPKVAEKDIVVWKVFRKVGFWKPQFISPYRSFLYTKKKQMPSVELSPIITRWHGTKYEEGYYSFAKKRDAMMEKKIFIRAVVRKCIIPKGARYVLGDFNSENDSYVSSTIILCATF